MSATQGAPDWRARAKALKFQTRPFIAGRFDDSLADRAFDCISPIDGRKIASLPESGARGVDAAVAAARKAFDSGVWSNMAPRARKKVLVKLAGLVEQHREELALLDTLSMGVPISVSNGYCTQWAINALEWYGEAIDKLYDEIAPTDRSVLAMITKEPIGVVGAVLPWNWPMGLLGWKVPPALAAGNSVVLKPDEQTSLSALRFAELAQEAGLPPGVLNVVTGGPAVGEAIGRHMDIDVVGFTGSTEVGKLFMKYSAESNMKPVWTECGGKGPNIVFADAPDLAVAAQTAAFAIFLNTGQVCAAGSRLIVEESARDQVLEIVKAVGAQLAPSDPLEAQTMLGPIAKSSQLERVLGYIDTGRKEGAQIVCGGNRARKESGGFYVEPTVFDRVRNDMRIAQEEIFGPVLSTITFRTPEEAIQLANASTYGLSGAIWTQNLGKAHTLARALRCGSVAVNAYADDAHDITVPFGGYKQSGFGRDKSLHALDKYTQLKTTWVKL
jgi:gamma-glutamyl-gamma-aminobutyraldehyde dehydrogenase/4-guanidinobutyraldehyde dehydrogenase/NAD-dependent aldehyde dehydrogenase